MPELVAGVDLGQRLAVAVVEVGRVPMQVRRLECYRWDDWHKVQSDGRTAGLPDRPWKQDSGLFLRDRLDWLPTYPALVAVAFERAWHHPTKDAPRRDPRSMDGHNLQVEELCRMFGDRAHGVLPHDVTRDTRITNASARYDLTALLLPPEGAPKNTGRIVDARSHWHPLLESFDGARGGAGVVEDVLSAMKLAYYAATRLVPEEVDQWQT